jgi:hypothetical protein
LLLLAALAVLDLIIAVFLVVPSGNESETTSDHSDSMSPTTATSLA